MPGVSLTTKVLIGLFAGLALGAAISASHAPALMQAATAVEPLGILFINAIRMTVMPLVIARCIGIASPWPLCMIAPANKR